MQTNRTYKVFTLALLVAALAGCAAASPQLDSKFGDSVNAAKARQTANPQASQNADPTAGVDGQAANAAVDRYHRSFERPPATGNIFTIGVGTGGGSTSGSGGMR